MTETRASRRAASGAQSKASGTGRTPRRRVRRVLKWVLFTLLGLFALGVLGIAVAYARIQVPQPNELANAQVSIVYFDDGKTEMGRLSDAGGNREPVSLSQVPEHVQHAVLAAEDRSFYDNQGISLTGIGRAVWGVATGNDSAGGGSTITQQYVRNYFLTQDRSLSRKFREILLSVKVEQQQSKDQILENYLNTIYYGRGAYGIQTASQAYFGKPVGQLTVAEGAVLASVLNGPSLYDPALGAAQSKRLAERVDYVLNGMVEEGWLSAADRAKISGPAKTIAPATNKSLTGTNGYIIAAVRKELQSTLKLDDADIDRGGLRITTTINKAAQDAAVASMDANMPKDHPDVYAGLVAVKPGTGGIVAMYGGADYSKRQFSSATDATMQAGSTFKAFALVAALQQGVSTRTVFDGSSPQKFGADSIENEGNQSFGRINLLRATAKSVNTVFANLNQQIGPPSTKAAAIAAGIPQNTAGLDDNLANVLGTASPHVVDVANAYATIAANGQRATAHLVATVSSESRGIDYTAPTEATQAFSADVAADTIDALQQVTKAGGTGSRAQQLDRPVAGKTGTSEEHKSVWFTGFTPQIAVSVGMFRDVNGTPAPLENISGISELSGNSIPLSIWLGFMQPVMSGQPVQDFPARVGIGDDSAPQPTSTFTPSPTTTSEPTTTTQAPPPTTTQAPAPTTTQAPAPTTTQPTTAPATQAPTATRTTQPAAPPAAEAPAATKTPAAVG